MGKEVVREELKLLPAKAVIVKHIPYTYACRHCEKHEDSVPVLKVPMPEPVIKGSFSSPEAVAHIMSPKFVMGIPLYRQEQEWKRQGIKLSRQDHVQLADPVQSGLAGANLPAAAQGIR